MRRFGVAAVVSLCAVLLILVGALSWGKTTIRWSTWLSGETLDTQSKLLDMFEKKYPDIGVKVETTPYTEYWPKLLTQHAAGMAPDVMHTTIYFADEFIRKGVFMEVSDLIKASGFNYDDYVPFSPIYKRGDKVWGGLETHNQVYPIFYNVDMFKAAGVQSPNDYAAAGNWNLNTFLEVARKFTKDTNGDGKADQWGFYAAPWWETGWLPWVLLFDANWVKKYDDGKVEITFDSPKMIEGMKWYIDLVRKHGVAPVPGEVQLMGTALEAKKAAMMTDGSWMMNVYKVRLKDFEWDIAPPPKGVVLRTHIDAGADGLVYSKTKYPKESWKLVEFFLGEEVQMEKARSKLVIPVLKRALNSSEYLSAPPKHIKVIHEMIDYAVPVVVFEGFNEVETKGIRPEVEAAFMGKKSVEQALKDGAAEARRILDRLGLLKK
ncbi:MAG: ABC transporter substrate-binding protein [bacterium]